ncbi:MAG: 23S rRNA (pseudouridine(1915)-N(3))-methyltransferase RlmH [Chlamydiia bacterium]|jgi:23S rRNA (pseudouridine1915-N3)-methyltransferase
MFKIKIITVGKTKESWLQEATEEYHKRIKHHILIEWVLCKSSEHLQTCLEKESDFLCLDPTGMQLTSEDFSTFLFSHLEKAGARMTLVIGGAEGLCQDIKKRALALISLSRMTLTHQMTRLILLEQIYRALEIRKGSGYHK